MSAYDIFSAIALVIVAAIFIYFIYKTGEIITKT